MYIAEKNIKDFFIPQRLINFCSDFIHKTCVFHCKVMKYINLEERMAFKLVRIILPSAQPLAWVLHKKLGDEVCNLW